jgi:uncharacterized membrane protein YcjF (UPF0283 family)
MPAGARTLRRRMPRTAVLWTVAAISTLLVALMINGLIHQERLRLMKVWQQEQVQEKRRALEEKRQVAEDRIKVLLRQKSNSNSQEDSARAEQEMKEAVAEMSAAIKAAKAHAAVVTN